MSGLLINANSLNIPLADGSVHTIVTSPPYYGLRDYGTAKWEGGDTECDHVEQYTNPQVSACSGGITNKRPDLESVQTASQNGRKQYRNKCAKCGAVRIDQQIGLEQTPAEYVDNIVQVFREVWRVLRDDGTVWLNLGDSYASMKSRYSQKPQTLNGGKPQDNEFHGNKTDLYHHKELGLKDKDLIGIPWMVAFALRDDGWYLRQDIIWHKPNPMPESVKDRCTKAHEYIFLLTKSPKYYYDYEAILEPATGYDGRKDTKYKGGDKDVSIGKHERWQYKNLQDDGQQPNTMHLKRLEGEEYVSPVRNRRSVWTIPTSPYRGAHYATFPPKLIEPMILAGCPAGGIVLDPFVGSGTTVMVANHLGRKGIGLDLNFKYLKDNAKERIATVQPIMFN